MENANVMNEKQVNRDIVRAPQGRYFALVTYLNEEQIKSVLEHYQGYIDSALYIKHDKDFKATDQDLGKLRADYDKAKRRALASKDEEHRNKHLLLMEVLDKQIKTMEQEIKEHKPEHWHMLIKFYTSRTEGAVRKYFYRFRFTETKTDENGNGREELINTLVEMVDDVVSIRDYLTHEDDPDKYHYPKSEVIQWGRGWECFNQVGNSVDSAIDIVDRLNHNCSLRRMAKEYGKDFIYHFKQYKEFAEHLAYQESKATRYVKLWEDALNKGKTEITAEYQGEEIKLKLDSRSFNHAVEIVAEYESDFQLYYQGE